MTRRALPLSTLAAALLLTGCGHKHKTAYAPPPPLTAPAANSPSANRPYETFPPSASKPARPAAPAATPGIVAADTPADMEFVRSHRPIWTTTGVASWYGPPYDRRRGANGEVYDQNMLSAANRELPLGSLIQVTNVRTRQSSVMRVTDRGPFVPGRVIDLSLASAKAIGVWGPGTATVQIAVFSAPKPIATGGRWCVQIGAFHDHGGALSLQRHLQRKYETANVIEFKGPTGYWVRIRPVGDNREQAEAIENSLRPDEGAAYLTRLD